MTPKYQHLKRRSQLRDLTLGELIKMEPKENLRPSEQEDQLDSGLEESFPSSETASVNSSLHGSDTPQMEEYDHSDSGVLKPRHAFHFLAVAVGSIFAYKVARSVLRSRK